MKGFHIQISLIAYMRLNVNNFAERLVFFNDLQIQTF